MRQARIIYDDVQELPSAFAFLNNAPPSHDHTLSVYLDTSIERIPRRDYVTFFRNSARAVREEIAADASEQLKSFDLAVATTEEFLRQEFAPKNPGVALFVSLEPAYFLVVPLPGRPAQDVFWGTEAFVTPLIGAMDEYEQVAVALVDKREARLYSIYLGAIDLYRAFESEFIGRHAAGDWPRRTRSSRVRAGRYTPGTGGTIAWSGMAQSRQRRKHDELAGQHIGDVAQALTQMMHERPFDRLFLAGTEEAVVMLRNALPRSLKARLAETLRLPINAAQHEILEVVLDAAQRREREEEVETVKRLIDQAGISVAVTGLSETLAAANDGRIDLLVIVSAFTGTAAVCEQCGRLTTATSICPSCGSELVVVQNIRERLVMDVIDQGGHVELVNGPAADLLNTIGGVGAFLRY